MVKKTYNLDTLEGQIEAAFDYRGNVTMTLKDGTVVDGFIFNREFAPKTGPAFVTLFLDEQPESATYTIATIQSIALTGEDTAAGKSWENWVAKKERAVA